MAVDSTQLPCALHRKFNSHFVRLGPKVVSVSDPALIPTIYGINTKFRKTEFYSIIDLWHNGKFTHSLFESRDEDYHARIRRPIASAYSMRTVMEFEPAVDSTVELLISKLDQFAASKVSFPLEKWLQYCTFDVLGEILFSRKLGFLEPGTDVESVVSGIRFFTKFWEAAGQIPFLDRFLLHNPLMKRYGPDVPMLRFAANRLRERASWKASGHATKRDFLQRCIEAQARYPDVVSDRMVVLYNFNNIGGGSDTTAITFTSPMYHLLKNLTSLQKVLEEVDRADKEGCLSKTVTWQEAGKLPYFQACIKEALRIHAPIGFILERYVPKGGISMGAHYFPEGTIVGINPWLTASVHLPQTSTTPLTHCHATFETKKSTDQVPTGSGQSGGSTLRKTNLPRWRGRNFGHGARECIGKNIAILEMTKLVPQLLRHYQIRI
ncbi:hypothetical protein G647_06849 [Cladophialophora carrionii CBS 160.54]|uniref:Cytochrome P450 oxidoreductase n=1 Tax=Cladophialophora carrionii CBS 160.54 TaxID=1279043 RepID=V9D8X9_9EURO|nr:uncharacterized protein G647_06849 [Cladophialophora carrionii CBS 160.54]ETI22773.1 hypothetical protein G647_06849 [Cladophialophora carrionii CBS 160.54]